MQRDARSHLNRFLKENERQKRELEARKKEMERISKEMDRKEALIHDENERRKLEEDKKLVWIFLFFLFYDNCFYNDIIFVEEVKFEC